MMSEGQNEGQSDRQWILDAVGLLCPEPVMLLHNKVRSMAVGDCLKMIATDPSTQRDVPKFCHFLEHVLVSQKQEDDQFIYVIKKGG